MSSTAPNGILFLRAQTALHPGAGASVGPIDLPIQRERHTGWPNIQGSHIKGNLRNNHRQQLINSGSYPNHAKADNNEAVRAIFGPPAGGKLEYAGALAVSDARIVAFPVRSARGVYALITCPAVISRLGEDMEMLSQPPPCGVVSVGGNDALATAGASNLFLTVGNAGPRLVLEDHLFKKVGRSVAEVDKLATWLQSSQGGDAASRLVVISDNAFTHLVRYATELATRIALDYETKTVAGTALFTQELLPPQTIFYTLLLAEKPHGGDPALKTADDIIQQVKMNLDAVKLLRIGGDATTGKGWCWARLATSVGRTSLGRTSLGRTNP